MPRRKFSAELKIEAVRLIKDRGVSIARKRCSGRIFRGRG